MHHVLVANGMVHMQDLKCCVLGVLVEGRERGAVCDVGVVCRARVRVVRGLRTLVLSART